MNSLITAAVLPILASGLAPHVIEDIPLPPFGSSSGDKNITTEETLPLPFLKAHEPSIEAPMGISNVDSPEEVYPRPPISWLSNLPRPQLGSVPYGEVITSCASPDAMALTFDDGPWSYTSDLLDLLAASDARATFFVCGGNMGGDGQLTRHGHPGLLRRMAGDGHQVGTHTWAHADLAALGDEDAVLDQMLRNEQAIVEALGVIPTYFRPPYFSYGGFVLHAAEELGYHVVNAGVDTRDWAGDYDAARENFDEAVRWRQAGSSWGDDADPDSTHPAGGGIVLAHDIQERTVYELAEYMIDQAREAGYRLVTVGECLGDPQQNWYRDPGTGGSWMPRNPGRGRAQGRGRGRGRGRGLGRHGLVEKVVVPPPDAPVDDQSSPSLPPDATPTVRHKLHIHTLPPSPTSMHTTTTAAFPADGPKHTTALMNPLPSLHGHLSRRMPKVLPPRLGADGKAIGMDKKKTNKGKKRSAVPGSHVAGNFTREMNITGAQALVDDEYCVRRGPPHDENRREDEGREQEQGEEQNHNEQEEQEHEHQHEREHEEAENQAHEHSVAGNATGNATTSKESVAAAGVRDPASTWGVVVAAVAGLCLLFP